MHTLITGNRGVGKTFVAHAIADEPNARLRPSVVVELDSTPPPTAPALRRLARTHDLILVTTTFHTGHMKRLRHIAIGRRIHIQLAPPPKALLDSPAARAGRTAARRVSRALLTPSA